MSQSLEKILMPNLSYLNLKLTSLFSQGFSLHDALLSINFKLGEIRKTFRFWFFNHIFSCVNEESGWKCVWKNLSS